MFEALMGILTVLLAGGLAGLFIIIGLIVVAACAIKGTIALLKWIFGIKPKAKTEKKEENK